MTIQEVKSLVEMMNLQSSIDTRAMLVKEVQERIKKEKLKVKLLVENNKVRLVDLDTSTESWLAKFVTVNQDMIRAKSDIELLATVNHEVLITGPTGTGKELLARALHGDREGKFVAINCAGLPETLIESLIFGHVAGAFTDAKRERSGLMQAAENGTFFLDEIGELPIQMQGKLLRALQERVIRKLGAENTEQINCRIVCATNKDLYMLQAQELFRLDLLARISTFEIRTTGLCKRPEDIEPILLSIEPHFVEDWKKQTQLPIDRINTQYNVRSLQQHVKRWELFKRLPI